MKTLLLSCTAAVALVSLAACEEGERDHHHHDHDRGQTTSTTTTEQTTVGSPVGPVTESRTVRSY
ncbi:MAG: hypothetical protein P4L99_25000 [Chthoniobacter sp.]|nr:hypothetical protein [Chthoniobacter sp.]